MKNWFNKLLDKWIIHRAFEALYWYAVHILPVDSEEHEDCVKMLDNLRKRM